MSLSIANLDCIGHMGDGGKNAAIIMSFFKSQVHEFDPGKTLSNTFFFDRAANFQKAGQILFSNFQQAICFHGGEHVLSLFLSDLSRIGCNKEMCILTLLFKQFLSNTLTVSGSENLQGI